MPKKLRLWALLWAICVIVVQGLLLSYQATPGAPSQAPQQWPQGSTITRFPGKATLIMFVHPSCDCSESSLREFTRLWTKAPQVNPVIVVSLDRGMNSDWVSLQSLKELGRSSRVTVHFDPGLTETDLFGVKTSGDVLLYSEEGRLLFSGGITSSRGHEGSARGQQLILEALQDGGAAPDQANSEAQVFGCPLSAPEDFCLTK